MRFSFTRRHPGHSPRLSRGAVRAGRLLLGLLAAAMPSTLVQAGNILTQRGAATAPVIATVTANLAAQEQGAAVATQSANELANVATALLAAQEAQTAARNIAAAAPSSVPNGLATGGVVPDSGLARTGVANPVTDWVGAATPTQSTAGGQTTVTVNQTAAQAILSWNSFNISPSTTVQFNQQQATWTALNRISASGVPSQIEGQIKAPGQVYLIDPNGIIFTGTSQVNTGALIASSASISNSQFTGNGIYSTEAGLTYAPSFTGAGGPITVQAGAELNANAPAALTTGGGFVLLMGTDVSNAGAITTPQGQAELAAGNNFLIRPGYSTSANQTSTTRGNQIAVQLSKKGSSLKGGAGAVGNTGLISADTGDITLAGESVTQDGVLFSTTTVSVRGTIHLLTSASDTYGNVTLGPDSLTIVEPDLSDPTTALDTQRAALIADSATQNAARALQANADFDDLGTLPDQEEDSRIEIVSGNSVAFQGGSQTVAQGGLIAVSAVKRVQTDTGALLDVAGTYGVALPVSDNAIEVNIQGYEQRDDPQNRLTKNLNNSTVYVDQRALSIVAAGAGGDASERAYTEGGVLEVSGYLNTTGHTIGEWTAVGGDITFATGGSGAIVAQSGATLNIDGGSIQYQAGEVPQSYLLGENGLVYNVNTAPAYMTYAGIYNGFTVSEPAWNSTQTYGNALSDPAEIEEPGYTEGRDAGTLTLDAPTTVFDATLEDGVVNGTAQTTQAPADVTDPYTLAQNVVAEPGTLDIASLGNGYLLPGTADVSFTATSSGAPAADAISVSSSIPGSLAGTTELDAASLSQAALGGLNVLTDGTISVAAPLTLAAGAGASLFGSAVTISADVTDPSGDFNAGNDLDIGGTEEELAKTRGGKSTTGNIILANGAVLSTAGLWTNLALSPNGPNDTAFANGGAVSLTSAAAMQLDTGSMINASAGASIAINGARSGGAGGAVTLALVNATGGVTVGDLRLAGTLTSTGFSAGGSLTLNAPNIDIGNATPSTNPAIITLQPGFFNAGFSAYHLAGQIGIAAETAISVTEPTEQFTAAAATVPTGGSTQAGATLELLPVYTANPQLTSITQRPGASLTLASTQNFTLAAGASITVDPKQSIVISGDGQMTVDGDLTAPGGTISLTDTAELGSLIPVTTYEHGKTLSVWLGADSRISTAAIPFTAGNAEGGSIALAPAGGTISIAANDAVVVEQAGALLDAAGDAATEQPLASASPSAELSGALPQGPVALAGAGGTISLASNNGLFLYGTMLAPAGRANAAGGTLALSLNSDDTLDAQDISDAPRILTITQKDTAPALPASLTPGASSSALARGAGQISAAQIAAGGFGTLDFTALDAFAFQGNVTLSAAQSITLAQGVITDTSATGAVALNAPYVELNGTVPVLVQVNGGDVSLLSVAGTWPSNSNGAFTVNAGLIDVVNALAFGGIETVADGTGTATHNLRGFASVNLNSAGELRFLTASLGAAATPPPTTLISTGNVNLTASTIFSTYNAAVLAGYDPSASALYGAFSPSKTLTISQAAGTTGAAPDDFGGSIGFYAATIADRGTVWDPLGTIRFGSTLASNGGAFTGAGNPRAAVELLPGSVTSVSAAGLNIPYGGTTDGVSYEIGGADAAISGNPGIGLAGVTLTNPSNGNTSSAISPGSIILDARAISVAQGATLDLSGGGNFAGEGFISGEGGSINVLTAPLLKAGSSGVSQPSLSADPVYAIVAGPQPETAPVADYTQTGATGSMPAVGAQIIIPAGVPGLPAGRYTLLPASYALNAGGYRVEFDGAASLAAPSVLALPNGSYAVAGQTGVVNTRVVSSLPVDLTITPAATVQNYANYDTESYSQFLIADAAQFGAERPALPEDSGSLFLYFPALDTAALSDAGTTDFAPASGGNGGVLQISGAPNATATQPSFDIYGASAPALVSGTVDLSANAIDAFDPEILEIGAGGQGFDANTAGITLEPGATLRAARVLLTALNHGITLDDGSEINTVGQGSLLVDSTTTGPYFDGGASVLDVGNGYLTYTDAGGSEDAEYGPITIQNGATIYTDGSIAFSTGAAVNIGVAANYGGADLDLAVPEINIGDPTALGAAAAPGLTLTPAVLAQLTAGVPAAGVPAVQILVLSASQSLNFFGNAALDLPGGNVQLVINAPAIYGYGSAGDVATVSAGTIVWNGDLVSNPTFTGSGAPGGVVADGAGTGTGTLDFDANTILFGYSDLDRPTRDVPLKRITLGFATVNLNAADEITTNNQGTLAVYQSQAVYGAPGTGGTLNLNTPLLTGGDGSTMAFTAGGALSLATPSGAALATALAQNAGGAELDLTADTLNLNSAVILPSGKLNLQATGDVTLGAGAELNLAGEVSSVLGTPTFGAGGTLIAASANGNITQAAGSVIDVSAVNNAAGSATFSALSPGAGTVALDGALQGSTTAAESSGAFTLAAQTVPDFAALNGALDAGGFLDSRAFELAQGNLTIGDGLQAQNISVSLDAGSLTVNGTIDANFGPAGDISLAAADDLTLTSGARLDAQGATLQTDSYGQPIAAANTSDVSLTTTTGELTLNTGAAINLASADGVARGDLELNVPRLGAGDANIAASAGVGITGAATIAVNAFATYFGLPDTAGDVSGAPDALITQAYLNQINTADTLPYMQAAAADTDLASRLAGLAGPYGGAFHFRPGVEITSATADGDLTVQGDLDLSGFRYGAGVNPAVYGSGEPGVLILRAGGNLNVYGSITDGFSPPVSDVHTSYADGWVLNAGQEPYGQNIVVPVSVTLAAGSSLGVDATVNYAVPTDGGTFASGAAAPTALTVSGTQTASVAFVATSAITDHGHVLYAAGAVVPAGSRLPSGAIIAAGGSFPFAVTVGPVTWPANTPFTITSDDNQNPVGTVVLARSLTLRPGSVIPGDSDIAFASGASSIATRTAAGGTQGQLIPLGKLLPAGDLSWSIQLVSGANTTAAATGAVQAGTALAQAGDAGNLTLADTHYGLGAQSLPVPAFSVVRTGTGALSLIAGGAITEASDYGVYTAGAQSAGIASADNLPQGKIAPGNTLLGRNNAALAALAVDYQANYPQGGGNVLVSAAGSLNGFISTAFSPDGSNALSLTDTDALGSWLWLQGGAGQPSAWWVEFGALEPTGISAFGGAVTPQLDGFQGIGTLGGGNLTVNAGGGASGLNLAVAATGRVLANGALAQTGGGNLTADIGGALNFSTTPLGVSDAGGLISDLRGNTTLDAGSIGTIVPSFASGTAPTDDPRVVPPLATELAQAFAGIDLAPGDGAVTVETRGDLVIDDVADPGVQANQVYTTPVHYTTDGASYDVAGGGTTLFTLWPANTSVALNSAGGDITPSLSPVTSGQNDSASDLYPPTLSAVAQNGNIDFQGGTVELAPDADGTLDLLAAGSIYGTAYGAGEDVSISGADPSLEATPFNPLINVVDETTGSPIYTNANINEGFTTIAFGPDTPDENLHADGQAPALVLAGTDIIGLTLGQMTELGGAGNTSSGYLASMPFTLAAGRDIVASGSITSPSVFLNLGAGDVTSIAAGRDILESSFDIAGPGNLLVQAGRDVYQAGEGVLDSIGPLFDINPDNRDGGAGITVIAGSGATGPDYAALDALYLNPDSSLSLEDASAIIAENQASLLSYLQTNFGYAGAAAGAYAYFESLPAAQRDSFLLDIYFAMLNQSGLEFNEPGSVRYKSYALGRNAIATLFPAEVNGQPVAYNGAITLFGPSGIHTNFGGAVQTLTPGGQTIVGVEGAAPPSTAGVITEGTGNIDMYSLSDVLLGESRVLTTFGGNILIWSAEGNINAGKGSKTTIDYTPLEHIYDNYGNIALSPNVPSTGAGIGTLNPIPSVPPGDINLVAPVGTVDAGEAGIRVSGNLNIAAAHVANAADIQVQGTSTGVPVASSVNVGALTSAGNTAGAAAQSANSIGKGGAAQALPSIWIVEILGYGGEGSLPPPEKHKTSRRR